MHPAPANSRPASRVARRWQLVAALPALILPLGAQTGGIDGIPDARPLPRMPRAVICFPPFPAPLDQPINRGQPALTGLGAPPTALAPYVSEFFYPQLSTHFAEKSLSEKQQQQIAAYRTTKATLLQELKQELARQREAEAPTRLKALQAFARAQTPRLVQLEKTAEQLRGDLIAAERNWSDYREWRLGDHERRGYSPVEIAHVMRAYAYYHKGLLPAQRRLLREISVELAMAVEVTKKDKAAAVTGNTVFFSPEMARVTMPDLSPEQGAKFAAYLTKKSTLKKELYDAVYKQDGTSTFFGNSLKSLAEKQAPAFAQLEALAEEVRLGLGAVAPPPDPLAHSAVPLVFVERLSALVQDRNTLQQQVSAQADAIIARTRRDRMPISARYAFENDRMSYTVYPAMRGAPPPTLAQQVESVRTALGAVADLYGRGLADLVNKRDEIRREIAELSGKDLAAVDTMLGVALRAAAVRESEGPYRDYRTAVFEPGLSPEQRRLLFDGAIEQLGMPLPRGEMQPSRRTNSW